MTSKSLNPKTEQDLFYFLTDHKKIPVSQVSHALVCGLIEKGLPIVEKTGHYYLKFPVIALAASSIRGQLQEDIEQQLEAVNIVFETQSTNTLVRDYLPQSGYSLLLTEYQTQGQGRRERIWQSPLAQNIYMSLAFSLSSTDNLNFIPLLAGIAICKALNRFGIRGVQIKWPNDIYLDGRKLGGILIEAVNRAEQTIIICGIGLNINMQIIPEIDQKWISLSKQSGIFFDRNAIIAHLINELITTFNKLNKFNFEVFIKDWTTYDFLNQKMIQVAEDNANYEARVKGLAHDGALSIEFIRDHQLLTKSVYAADVSVKAETSAKN